MPPRGASQFAQGGESEEGPTYGWTSSLLAWCQLIPDALELSRSRPRAWQRLSVLQGACSAGLAVAPSLTLGFSTASDRCQSARRLPSTSPGGRDERNITQRRIGQQVEVGRYEIPTGERVLVGRRIDGEVHIFDCPRSGRGRRYFVEKGFESKAELRC